MMANVKNEIESSDNVSKIQPLFTNLCEVCHKKVKLYAVQCKCKKKLCKNHVFPQNHDCDFDYKYEGKLILEKTLIPVQSQKIDKI
mgnify:FL=1|jgi:predicted nucleic acid binding AN1-type Zn finger protein